MRSCLFVFISCFIVNIICQDAFQEISPTRNEELLKQDKKYWYNVGEQILQRNLKFEDELKNTPKKAKNVVIFVGDGMGISTITAGRIFKGQRQFGKSGEEHELYFEQFPNVGLSKTYNVDMQIPDSAGTATALLTGVKTRYKSLGVDVNCNRTSFDSNAYENCKVDSIMTWAQAANKSTGIVTTTRITHATPGATYAHVNFRNWECDTDIPENAKNDVKDIARQLVEDEPGKNFKVILGGGQSYLGFSRNLTKQKCVRDDGKNLTQVWTDMHRNKNYVLATNTEQLNAVNEDTEYLMGLFASGHMDYEIVRDKTPQGSPSLSDMVKKALTVLKNNENGFVLLVEGGKIDLAHHDNYARVALEETAEFDNAVSYVVNETDSDTTIIVTADHSHAFTINGYSARGNDILGFTNQNTPDEHKPFLTVAYANGPGFNDHYGPSNSSNETFPWIDARTNRTNRLNNPFFRHLGSYYLKDETHGGEDVAVYAKGPNSNLIRGVFEQNYIAHFISYTACIGPRQALNPACREEDEMRSGGLRISSKDNVVVVSIISLIFFAVFTV